MKLPKMNMKIILALVMIASSLLVLAGGMSHIQWIMTVGVVVLLIASVLLRSNYWNVDYLKVFSESSRGEDGGATQKNKPPSARKMILFVGVGIFLCVIFSFLGLFFGESRGKYGSIFLDCAVLFSIIFAIYTALLWLRRW